jgi:Serine dehydrogenase proteinase
MSWDERIQLYEKIESHRKRPLIVYVTSKRDGCAASMSSDALPSIIEQVDGLPTDTQSLDLLIASYGGDPMVAWRVLSIIRQRVTDVAVLVPQSAYSAATLLAFGANEIIMHPHGHLGPVDMQITTVGDQGPKSFSTEDITAFLDFVRDTLRITDQEHIRALFEVICKEVGSLGIGFTVRSSKLAIDLGQRLLALHMKDDDTQSKLRSIVQNMSRKFQSHSYTVSRTEALDIGLPVNKERDRDLEKLMWDAWIAIEQDLKETTPFDPIFELLNSTEGAKLLSPVPLISLPMAASASAHFSTTIADVMTAATVSVEPVAFEHTNAIVESSRLASAHTTKGKILATRNPDLMIRYNIVTTARSWERLEKLTNK